MNKRYQIQVFALLLFFAAAVTLPAQNLPSATQIGPLPNRMGSQLVYFFEEGNSPLRGTWKSYLAVTNMNIAEGAAVDIHVQFYTQACTELFDFVDTLAPGKTWVYDPAAVRRAKAPTYPVGMASDDRYIMTITAVPPQAGIPYDMRGYSFNWLSGQFWIIDVAHATADVHNAAARPVVDNSGAPAADGFVVDGTNYSFQKWQPASLELSSFWPTSGIGAVRTGMPFGNRLTFLSFRDDYNLPYKLFRIQAANVTLNPTAYSSSGAAYPVSPKSVGGLTEFTIATNPPGMPGNFPDVLDAPASAELSPQGGWLRILANGQPADGNLLAWFSQHLDNPPTIIDITANPGVLWPPNHKMVPVKIRVTANDDVTPVPVCRISSVTSNEPINGLGDGDASPDWLVTGALDLQLRAERGALGNGRIYTITVSCSDAAGNTAKGATTITVPHDMSK